MPFKTPLVGTERCPLDEEEELTIDQLLEAHPTIGLIINLKMNKIPYNLDKLKERGIEHVHIPCKGGTDTKSVPTDIQIERFCQKATEFKDSNPDKLIGVTCINGNKQSAYMICKYLHQKCGLPIQDAINSFNEARGHDVYSKYLKALRKGCQSPDEKASKQEKLFPQMNVSISNNARLD